MTNQPTDPDWPRHPIAVVAERTGLSQDVLRVWERRYGAVRPTRTAGGERLYSDADIHRLRLLHAATAGRRRIASVAALPTIELGQLVAADEAEAAPTPGSGPLSAPNGGSGSAVDAAMDRVRAFDAGGLDALLRQSVLRLGVFPFLEQVAAPLLARVGDEWHGGRLSIAEEHLASAVVEHLAREMTRTTARADGPRLVVATPAGARHIIGAALLAAGAAAEGWSVVFLGGDVPADEIARATESANAEAVALSVVYAEDPRALLEELKTVRARLPAEVPLLVGGRAAATVARELEGAGIGVGATFADLRELLATPLAARSPARAAPRPARRAGR